MHAKALPGNPYDGHTLKDVIEETQALTGREIERAYVDKGYRGRSRVPSWRLRGGHQGAALPGRVGRPRRNGPWRDDDTATGAFGRELDRVPAENAGLYLGRDGPWRDDGPSLISAATVRQDWRKVLSWVP